MTAKHGFPAPNVGDLKGLWQRSMIERPDGTRDTTSHVRWLQGQRVFIDLRQPAAMRDYSHVLCRNDLSAADCACLASQEGFAGHLVFDGGHFEWVRRIDYQPASPTADAGSLAWEDDVLVERGRDVDYVEHWHRGALHAEPCTALQLREAGSASHALLLRVGAHFMFARGRPSPEPLHGRLREHVACAANLAAARALVDCEISFGMADGFKITHSTLPYRRGALLCAQLRGDTVTLRDQDPDGAQRPRRWDIVDCEGDAVQAFE